MIIGLDISTSIVGTAILTDDAKLVKIFYSDLRKIEDIMDKCLTVANRITLETINYNETTFHLFVEQYLMNFRMGQTMMQTLLKLASFNGMVSSIVYDRLNKDSDVHLSHLHPSTVRAMVGLKIPKGADKKALTVDFVASREGANFPLIKNRNDKLQPYVYDMADSYIVALAGYNIINGQNNITEKSSGKRKKKEK